MSTSPGPHDDPGSAPLDPPPAWLSRIAAAHVTGARVRVGRQGLVYQIGMVRMGRSGRLVLSLPLHLTDRSLWWDRAKIKVFGDLDPGKPHVARLAGERLDPSSTMEHDARRHASVLDFLTGGSLRLADAPQSDQRPLFEILSVLGRGSVDPPERWVHSEDSFVVAARVFIDLLVRQDVQALMDPLPPAVSRDRGGQWLQVLSATLSGDIEGLRRLASRHPLPGQGTPLSSFCGAVFKDTGFFEAALTLLEDGKSLTPARRSERCIELAQILLQLGETERARGFLREAVLTASDDPRRVLHASRELLRVGAIDDAFSVLSEAAARMDAVPDVLLCMAQLQHVAGQLDAAYATLRRIERLDPGRRDVARERGALAMTESRYEDARGILGDVFAEDPRDWVAGTWLTEAHLRLGDIESARRALKEARSVHDSPIHTLLQCAMSDGEEVAKHTELEELLRHWSEPWSIQDVADRHDPYPARARIFEILSSFRGSRGEDLTRVSPLADGPTGVRAVSTGKRDDRSESRSASASAIKAIVTRPLEVVFESFDRIIEQYPDSPHPWCYRGELRLWLGDYAAALDDFDAALGCEKARWAYIGRAAVHLLAGRREEGMAEVEVCRRSFDAVPSATTHIYVGESDRKAGRLDTALLELEESVRVKPGRLSGWINLVLTHHALGHRERASELLLRRVVRVAPRLLRDAARAAGLAPGRATTRGVPSPEDLVPLLEQALLMMRGNRSSHTVTYFDHDGVFRLVRDAHSWVRRLPGLRLPVWEEARRRALHGVSRDGS
ncbi:tetratricopeptide repeat protein [Paraliomyxa miuraensis]|uniref:tetratricopeptide repeat protein n=1 Tax=Paraliomyxa miuraensis TaxID=376150 RepID=UPI002251BC11|nr:tetratricopeptide repeat protein [Paraliomyxa miuraensis]MCX4243665.1 hypothetical protein [Paraliomyxa miuraensis]